MWDKSMSESKIAEIKKTKGTIKSYLTAEKDARDLDGIKEWGVWIDYGSLVRDYDASFSEVLPGLGYDSIRSLLSERKTNGLTTHVLDLMGGDASFLRDLRTPIRVGDVPISTGASLCVALVDERSDVRKALEKKLRVDILEGDITSNKTWCQIDQWQKENEVSKFDLIVCRGVGGVEEKVIPQVLYPYLFGKIWGRLSSDNGLFITQLPHEVARETVVTPLLEVSKSKFYFQSSSQSKLKKHANTFPALGVLKTG